MNIFDKRPLSLILCVALSGFVIFTCSSLTIDILLIVGAILLLSGAIVYSFIKHKIQWIAIICAVIILLAVLLSFLYFDLYFVIAPTDDEVTLVGTVTEIENKNGLRSLMVKTESVSFSDNSHYKILLNASLDETENISVGSVIKVTGFLDEIDEGTKAFLYSDGISASISEFSSVELLGYTEPGLEYEIKNYRNSISRRIVANSDSVGGGFLCALLLGDRSYMDSESVQDFMRTGLTHVLALSGMHLAILSFALTRLLGAIGLNKKIRKIIEIIFVILYMALTGFPVSVVRAGVMLIISAILFLLSQTMDSITNLFLSVVIIVAVQPYSVFDIGLWLSAFATLGILLLVETVDKRREYEKKKKLPFRLLQPIWFSILSSAFAISATLILSFFTFGYISVITLLSTPIFSLLITPFLCLGVLFAIVGDVLFLGELISGFGSFILNSIRLVSRFNGIYSSAEYIIVEIAIFITVAVFLCFAILKFKKKAVGIILIFALTVTVSLCAFSAGKVNDASELCTYNLSGASEWIIMNSDEGTSVIDMSNGGTKSASNSFYLLDDERYTEIKRYVFTDYTSGMVAGADKLVGLIYVEEIYVPEPANEDELRIFNRLSAALDGSKAELVTYKSDDVINCGEFTFYSAYRSTDGKNKFSFTILHNDKLITYLSSGMLEDDTKNVATKLMSEVDTLILGCHGNSYSNFSFIYQIEGVERIVLSSKNLSIPIETLKYYAQTEIITSPEKISLIR